MLGGGKETNHTITQTEVELETECKPALPPKPMFFLSHKNWLLRETNTATLTASLTPLVRGSHSLLAPRLSTCGRRAACRLTSPHPCSSLTPSRLCSAQTGNFLQFPAPEFSLAGYFAHSCPSAWNALPRLYPRTTPTGPADAAETPPLSSSWASASP